MAITYEILTFPTLPVQGQLFRAPGQAYDGGFTAGGARLMSPEPGGRAFLDVQLSLQTNERDNPAVSWLMSKLNGDIFSVPLTKTPQLLNTEAYGGLFPYGDIPWAPVNNYSQPTRWDNSKKWMDEGLIVEASANALEGSTSVSVNMLSYGEILQRGHVIGFGNYSYMIDAISYSDSVATIRVKPPLRKAVSQGDFMLTRPYFQGTIINGQEFAANYEAINNGHIKPPRLIFSEVII